MVARKEETGGSSFPEVSAATQELLERNVCKHASTVLFDRDVLLGVESASSSESSSLFGKAFDVDSMTPALVTFPLIAKLIDEGLLGLEDRVSRVLSEFGILGKSKITVAHLLCSCSGMPESVPYYRELKEMGKGLRRGIYGSRHAKDVVYQKICSLPLEAAVGTPSQHFSELNWLILGMLFEAVSGQSLRKASERLLFRPLHLRSTGFISQDDIHERELEVDSSHLALPLEEGAKAGVVCHENTRAMGGVSGFSGLFSSAEEMFVLARLTAQVESDNLLLSAATKKRMLSFAEEHHTKFFGGFERKPDNSLQVRTATGLGLCIWPEEELGVMVLSSEKARYERDRRFEQQLDRIFLEAHKALVDQH